MSNKWVEEEIEPGFRVQYRMTKICDSTTTNYQTVDLVRPRTPGRCAPKRATGAILWPRV